jgi:hypothetical protein
MRLSPSRVQASRYAAEILRAITNNDPAELECRLAAATVGCQTIAGLASFEAEAFAALDACVETLKPSAGVSVTRRDVALQILRHLAENDHEETTTSSRIRRSCRLAATDACHRSQRDRDSKGYC